tara:strand:- start:2113 stop:2457 length:345 start_codon:yes stop_codon:yes gene_type:complete
MQNKDDKTKQTRREEWKMTLSVCGIGLLILTLFLAQCARRADASELSKLDQCIQRAVDTIEEESGGVDMDEWFYVVSIKDGKCVFVIGENEDYTRELLENQRELDYQQRNQRTF